MITQEYIWLPALSGFIIQLLNLFEAARLEPARRPNFKDPIYWLPYLVGPVLGGFVGYISFSDHPELFTPMLGAQVGAAAPLILKGLANTLPQRPANVQQQPSPQANPQP